MKTYEVFLRTHGAAEFKHAGSLLAPSDELAEILARETYARRAEGDQMWLVERSNVISVDEAFIAPNADKPHRHNDGKRVAAHRRDGRERAAS